MTTPRKNSHLLFTGYLLQFSKALDTAIVHRTDITLEEKIRSVKALLEILELHLENPEEAVDYKLIGNIVMENITEPLRKKAVPIHSEKLWVYFEPLSDRYFQYLATETGQTAFTDDDYLSDEQHQDFLDRAFSLLELARTSLYLISPQPGSGEEPITEKGNKEFTRRRQVLVMYYLDKALNISNGADRTSYAQLIELLTSKNYKNIYDYIRNPFPEKTSARLVDDLKYIREYFVKLKQDQIITLIDKDIQLHK